MIKIAPKPHLEISWKYYRLESILLCV